MKYLALSIGTLGAAHASFWVWAPKLARWQTQNALERLQENDALEVVMQAFDETMRYTYIESAITGLLMVIASALLLVHRRAGWNLWLGCLGWACMGVLATLAISGISPGLVLRVLLLAGFGYATFTAHKGGALASWL